MASTVDICNMALAFLGDRATVSSINPPEGSAQADHCARFYPLALNEMLRAFPWTFATRRAVLAEVANKPEGADYAYAVPAGMVTLQRVMDEGGRQLTRFALEQYGGSLIIVTQEPVKYVLYTTSDTAPELFPAAFSEALAHLLAAKLAGPVITGASGAELSRTELQIYQAFLSRAMTSDALLIQEKAFVRNPFMGDFEVTPEADYGSY